MSDEMVTIATFGDPLEAQLFKNRLEDQGVAAFVTGGESGGLFAGMGGAFGLVRLLVAARDEERALAILDDAEEETGHEEPAGEETGIKAPEWGRPGPSGDDRSVRAVNGELLAGEPPGKTSAPDALTEDADEYHIAWGPEALAARALKTAVIGLILFPLLCFLAAGLPVLLVVPVAVEAYALWLLLQVGFSGERLSPVGKWRVAGSLVIAVPLLGLLGFVMFGAMVAFFGHLTR